MTRYLIDTSTLTAMTRTEVAAIVTPLCDKGSVATCGAIELSLLTKVRDLADLPRLADRRALAFTWLPTEDRDFQRAVEVQRRLAEDGHRLPGWPLLVAAVAERHGVVVVHDDTSFELIAAITGQPVERTTA